MQLVKNLPASVSRTAVMSLLWREEEEQRGEEVHRANWHGIENKMVERTEEVRIEEVREVEGNEQQ